MRVITGWIAALVLLGGAAAASAQDVYVGFGDSITTGWPYRTSPGNGCTPSSCNVGYEPTLQAKLGTGKQVQNWGIPGEMTGDGMNRIDGVLSATQPRYVLLMEGTNDLFWVDPATVRTNLLAMVNKSKQHGAVPILATLTPDTRPGSGAKNIPSFNSSIKQMGQDYSISVCDQYAAVVNNWNNLSYCDGNPDGDCHLHPNTAGYAVIGETWSGCVPHGGNIAPWLNLLLDDN